MKNNKNNKFLEQDIVSAEELWVNNLNLESCRDVEQKLQLELKVLAKCLENPDFGVGEYTIGSELEMPIVNNNNNFMPAMLNKQICEELPTESIQTEISKFCLEYNGKIVNLSNKPLDTMSLELNNVLKNINKICLDKFNVRVVPIGVLPTITLDDLSINSLTPNWRYKAIDKLLRLMRENRKFIIDIDGQDPLEVKWHNTVIEGVNNSFQVHLRVNPHEFNDLYNAAQLASSFVLAVCANSPILFGHRLWDETRVPIYEQTVNNHDIHPGIWQEQQRVFFGRGWVHNGVLGLLQDACELFHPIFPSIDNQPHTNYKANNKFNLNNVTGPDLKHLVQHNGSVWPWNRPIYDANNGGHFRIEMRYLPAGPTVYDMTCNAAFMLGLTKAFSKIINKIIAELPFKYAQYNFYQAAQKGLQASCIWYDQKSKKLSELPIIDLYDNILDLAAEGMIELNYSSDEVAKVYNCIKQRIVNRQTGATWQRDVYNNLLDKYNKDSKTCLEKMFKLYAENQELDIPVASWSKA